MSISIKDRLTNSIKQQNGQATNFARYYSKMEKAQDYVTVRQITADYYAEQDKLNKGQYMFAKQDTDKFWELQRELKDKFIEAHVKARKAAVQEVEELIRSIQEVSELKMLKKEIYNIPVLDLREITTPLYEQCDERIKELSA